MVAQEVMDALEAERASRSDALDAAEREHRFRRFNFYPFLIADLLRVSGSWSIEDGFPDVSRIVNATTDLETGAYAVWVASPDFAPVSDGGVVPLGQIVLRKLRP